MLARPPSAASLIKLRESRLQAPVRVYSEQRRRNPSDRAIRIALRDPLPSPGQTAKAEVIERRLGRPE